jgi:serine/threonine protein kinase/tetratricopeptide (TPR) repeat protein
MRDRLALSEALEVDGNAPGRLSRSWFAHCAGLEQCGSAAATSRALLPTDRIAKDAPGSLASPPQESSGTNSAMRLERSVAHEGSGLDRFFAAGHQLPFVRLGYHACVHTAPLGNVQLGKYELLCLLATGGMASVHLARAKGIGGFEKLLVIKRIHPRAVGDPSFIQMFLDEARIAATLEHSNVVHVFDVGSAQDEVFLAMEFLHGHDVWSIVRARPGPLPFDATFAIVIGACAGLHYAHEKRGARGHPLHLVHRDVSPSNIVVTYDGGVKVIDFGIAKATNRLADTKSGGLKGKPGYMSPEQCAGEALDRRSDVFCVGILLYELTTGTRLFGAKETEYLRFKAIVESDAVPPSALVPGFPAELERIVLRALARDASKRHPTALDLQRDLEELARELRLDVSPTSLAKFMETTFREELDAWRAAEQTGASLAERVAVAAQERPISFVAMPSGEATTKTEVHASIQRGVIEFDPTEPPSEPRPSPLNTKGGTVQRMAVTRTFSLENMRRSASRRWRKGAALGALTVIVTAALFAARTRTRQTSAPPPAAHVPAMIPITSLPLPASTSRAALEAYAEGIQAQRDGASTTALSKFEQATEKDPMLAAAHLRAAIVLQDYDAQQVPARFERARELRQFMSERDQGLLDAVEPTAARSPADPAESERRLFTLLQRYPGDAEVAFLFATLQGTAGDVPESVVSAKMALALDPQYMAPLALLGEGEAYLGDFEQALKDLDRCMTASGAATQCLYMSNLIQAQRGACDAAAQQRHLATTPVSTVAEEALAEAAIARGEPLSVAKALVDRQIGALLEGTQAVVAAGYAYRLAILSGNFGAAEAAAHHLEQVSASDPDVGWHVFAASALCDVFAETGRTREEGKVARAFLTNLGTWAPEKRVDDDGISRDQVPRLLAHERSAGVLSRDEMVAKRSEWLASWEARVPAFYRGYLWLEAYAETVETPEDAREALDALPRYGGVPPFRMNNSVSVGRVYWLAGQLDEAQSLLEQEVHACTAIRWAYRHVRAVYLLGRVKEARGDVAGACAAYEDVLARWGHAAPRSMTADDAKARMLLLACARTAP